MNFLKLFYYLKIHQKIKKRLKKAWRFKKLFVHLYKKKKDTIRITNINNSMKTTLHISNWQSFSTTAEMALCGNVYNNINIKQPRTYKPGMKWFELNKTQIYKTRVRKIRVFLFLPQILLLCKHCWRCAWLVIKRNQFESGTELRRKTFFDILVQIMSYGEIGITQHFGCWVLGSNPDRTTIRKFNLAGAKPSLEN